MSQATVLNVLQREVPNFPKFLDGIFRWGHSLSKQYAQKRCFYAVKSYALASNILPEAQMTSLVYTLVARRVTN